MSKFTKSYFLVLLFAIGLLSCNKPDNPRPTSTFNNGYFIVNEGNFQSSNGSVSFYNTKQSQLTNNVFESINDRTLGDVVQSMSIYNQKGYVVVNNSNKMEVTDNKLISVATINSLDLPRYFAGVNSAKGYLTNWGTFDGSIASYVAVIDLNNNIVSKTIELGAFQGAEYVLVHDDKAYVTHNFSNKISVINTATDEVKTSILVGISPSKMLIDSNDKLWVLCSGSTGPDGTLGTDDDIDGKLIRINPNDNSIETELTFPLGIHPSKMVSKENTLYYSDGNVYKFDLTSNSIPTTPFVKGSFYGIGVNSNGILYTGSASFVTQSEVKVYDNNGHVTESLNVGVATNGFIFDSF